MTSFKQLVESVLMENDYLNSELYHRAKHAIEKHMNSNNKNSLHIIAGGQHLGHVVGKDKFGRGQVFDSYGNHHGFHETAKEAADKIMDFAKSKNVANSRNILFTQSLD